MTPDQSSLVERVRGLLGKVGTLPISPTWMYWSIRHCVRNMDFDLDAGGDKDFGDYALDRP